MAKFFARRLRAVGAIAAALLIGSCTVPQYSFSDGTNPAPDSGEDVIGNPDSTIDHAPDTQPDVPPVGCSSNQDCTPTAPVCDPSTKTCVKCTPDEGCPAGTYCDANKCVPGCKTDKDCVPGGDQDAGTEAGNEASPNDDASTDGASSGGAPNDSAAPDASESDATSAEGGGLKCDPTTNKCVGCTGDQDCPPGTLCDVGSSVCVFGCSPTKACPTGLECCADPAGTAPATCVDLMTSVEHCGACDALCAPPGATGECVDGKCKATGCSTGYGDCDGNPDNGCEADFATDVANCGGCGKPCAPPANATAACSAGVCGIGACKPGFEDCDFNATTGCEVNLLTNPSNCGACGKLCNLLNSVEVCQAGICGIGSCEGTWFDCDGVTATGCEIDVGNDAKNCGSCGKVCLSTGGTATCTNKTCGIGCIEPYADCNGLASDGCEIDKNNDVKNCGGCGIVCNLPNAQSTCNNAKCAIESCNTGYADCDGLATNGCETNLNNNADNCGACGAACSKNNGTPTCALGACSIACNSGYENCDANVANGCEINTTTNVDNCGGCGKVCSATGGVPNCVNSKCGISNCIEPFADCDANATNGCEVNTAGDTANCGGCGKACFVANGTSGCTGGTCNIASCNAGYADCDAAYADGCEASLTTVLNCGACGQLCVLPNANGTCATGSCEVASCLSPYANCDGKASNGCEVDTSSNVSNCGGCGLVCNSTHGSPLCKNSACDIVCAAGYGNCNASAADGCETNLSNNVSDCGACGNVCTVQHGTPTCNGTTCAVLSCSAPWANCDSQYSNGCETDTSSSVSNCGGCGIACNSTHGTPSCAGSSCQIACTPGYGNCNGSAADGCETDLGNDVLNCGTCGKICSFPNAGAGCFGSACQLGTCNTGYGNCNGVAADGCEANLKTDPLNCNACGAACNLPHAVASCSAGVCGVASCVAPWADCDGNSANGCEVDTSTSPTNCGACGSICNSQNGTATCSGSTCGITCNAGFANCDALLSNGCETNILTDVNNCNGCGNVCSTTGGTPNCVGGVCGISSCSAGLGDCDGKASNGCETNLTNDPNNCKTCGNACIVANGTGACVSSTCTIGSCQGGFADCDGLYSTGCETNLHTNANCGGCGLVCSLPNATTSCSTGICAISSCIAPYANCDGLNGNGCEANTDTSTTNCGGCGTACSSTNGTPSCAAGVCSIVCNAGYGNCDGLASNGCETVTTNNVNDCGGCGITCSVANGTPACVGTTCTISSCTAPYQNCNGLYSDGCETNTSNSVSNCGACGNVCNSTNGTASCASSTCSITCNAGYGNCDGSLANGCEVNLNTNALHCGNCTTACTYANASGVCSGGSCQLGACNAGWANCDAIASNGCETSLGTVSNCGACGVTCTNANGTTSCTGGVCKPTCAAGFADCDGNPNNGCETSVKSLTNCGGCGVVCSFPNASASCSTGVCTMGACNAGWGNCDGLSGNGCETSTNTSVTNCGSCGNVCNSTNGTPNCSGGACGISCNSGYGNCDGVSSNGCEINLNTDPNHCGSCPTVCSFANASATCFGGACQLGSCNAGYGNCDGIASNGCETPLNTNTNCTACGVACSLPNAATSCSTGSCQISSCNAGFANCDGLASNGCEVNTNTDPNNCSACGTKCAPPGCSSPSCTAGVCGCSTCTDPYRDCDGNTGNGCETNTSNNVSNCGACGNVCTLANATPICVSSTCQVSTCNAGWGNCDGIASNGCETNTQSSVANCGACGAACNSTNGTASCSLGACSIVCNAGWGNCDGLVTTGCETALNTTSNCGACGNACTNAHGTTACTSGACNPSCAAGWGNCDGNPNNGCETALNTSTNCSACGVACNPPNSTSSCTTGTCQISSCNAGYGNCDGLVSNGCETALNTTSNCGACNVTCTNPNGTTTCTSGACNPTCNAGYGNCDGNPNNGCETSLQTDVNHCGNCTTVCSFANASASCSGGSCVLGSCSAGWGNCDGIASNGCETALNTVSNCGSCGTACTNAHGTTNCTGGACVPSCAAGWGNCDGNPNNGCETSLTTTTNCGTCGVACNLANATSTCSTGSCQISSCNAGWGNCDGITSNGCETNTQTSVSNCGACGTPCSNNNGAPSCALGSCSIACNANYGNCDGDARSNGCEVNLLTDNSHCGSCPNACSVGYTCVSGTCQASSCTCSGNTANCDNKCTTGPGGCECATPGCCGSGCQNTHNGGFGASYYDCVAPGTYDQTQAFKACEATDGAGMCSTLTCGGDPVVCSSGSGDCKCWMFTGSAAGSAYNGNGKSCWCCTAPCGSAWN